MKLQELGREVGGADYAAVSVALLGLTTAARTDEPKKEDNVTKLLGKWKITKATDVISKGWPTTVNVTVK